MPPLRRRRPDSKPERIRSGQPLSPNEERYVLSEVMARQTYGNPWTVRLRGRLDEPRFRDALQQLCDRHEARRTGFEASGDGRFTRYVEARGRPEITWISLPGASEPQLREAVRRWCLKRGNLSAATYGFSQSAMILAAGSVILHAPRSPLPRPLTGALRLACWFWPRRDLSGALAA